MTTTLAALAAQLHVKPDRLAALEGLDEAQLTALTEVVTRAFEAEDRAFDAGLEEALGMVPRILRPAAKTILFGGGRG